MNEKINDTLQSLAEKLLSDGKRLVTVESCTGGGVAASITDVPGSSSWFDRGWVTYSNEAKTELVGVGADLIKTHGAVSEQVARAMAEGAIRHSPAGCIAVSLTGIAGPDGGSEEKPVGTVYIAWSDGETTRARRCLFAGNRNDIRQASIHAAFTGAVEFLQTRSDQTA